MVNNKYPLISASLKIVVVKSIKKIIYHLTILSSNTYVYLAKSMSILDFNVCLVSISMQKTSLRRICCTKLLNGKHLSVLRCFWLIFSQLLNYYK